MQHSREVTKPSVLTKPYLIEMSPLDPSRLQALLRSNVPPTHLYARQMMETLDESKGYISILDTRIEDARAILEGLLQERQEHITRTIAYRTILSPIRRVPPELVADIFVRTCPKTSILPPAADNTNLRLSQICSGWRKVALGTPQLWADVTIHWEPIISYPVFESILKTWFHRSLPLPLSVLFPYLWNMLTDFATCRSEYLNAASSPCCFSHQALWICWSQSQSMSMKRYGITTIIGGPSEIFG